MKFIYASAAILASSIATVSGQSTVGNWDITYNNTETNFVAEAANDITVKYLISTGRNYTAEVFDKDCSTAIDTSVLIGKEDVLSTGSPDDLLEVKLNIDKSEIVSSNIWNTADSSLEFCVKVQLKSELGSVIKYENREITVDIDTDIDVAVNDVQVTNPDTSLGTGGATANVDTYVSACKCVYGSFECNNNAISSSNTLSVCIKSSSADVELMNLTSLDLLQAGTNEAMSVVLNNAEVESSISTIEGGKLTRFIETIVPTRFFQAQGNIVVSGVIEVQLKGGTGTRRLNLSQLSLDTAGGTRAMRGESVAVIRPGLLDDDDEEEFVSSDFGFPVGLVADSAEVPASSGNVTFGIGAGVAIIMAICQAFSYW